jgi:hypothetical protein
MMSKPFIKMKEPMSNLLDHATEELRRAKFLGSDEEYDEAIATSVLELLVVFEKQGHSGFSAMTALAFFDKLAKFEPLTPLTNDPNEWVDVTAYAPEHPLWQNNRNSSCFSTDGGTTYYDVDEIPQVMHTSEVVCVRLN